MTPEKIPSMGGGQLEKIFSKYAAQAPDGSAIVELGTWVGAGTLGLIKGVEKSKRNVEIHTYDKFVIRGNEVDKAAKFGVELKDKQDSLPLVKDWLSGHDGVKVIFHKGEITKAIWNKKPIFLYIDDACKYEGNFLKALKIFSPYWIPGETIIILMDFYFYLRRPYDEGLKFQKDFIDSHKENFKFIGGKIELCTAIFLYKGGLEL